MSGNKDELRDNEFEADTEFPLCSLYQLIPSFVTLILNKRCALGSLVFLSYLWS